MPWSRAELFRREAAAVGPELAALALPPTAAPDEILRALVRVEERLAGYLEVVSWGMIYAYVFFHLTAQMLERWAPAESASIAQLTSGLPGIRTFELHGELIACADLVRRDEDLVGSSSKRTRRHRPRAPPRRAGRFGEAVEESPAARHRWIGRDLGFHPAGAAGGLVEMIRALVRAVRRFAEERHEKREALRERVLQRISAVSGGPVRREISRAGSPGVRSITRCARTCGTTPMPFWRLSRPRPGSVRSARARRCAPIARSLLSDRGRSPRGARRPGRRASTVHGDPRGRSRPEARVRWVPGLLLARGPRRRRRRSRLCEPAAVARSGPSPRARRLPRPGAGSGASGPHRGRAAGPAGRGSHRGADDRSELDVAARARRSSRPGDRGTSLPRCDRRSRARDSGGGRRNLGHGPARDRRPSRRRWIGGDGRSS